MGRIEEIVLLATEQINNATTLEELNNLKAQYLSKKSEIAGMMANFRNMTPEERTEVGKKVNDAKTAILDAYTAKQASIEARIINEKLKNESIDISLPSSGPRIGAKNPFYHIVDEAIEIFRSMGFDIVEGPEVETDHYNFELLNLPQDHPARDMQDTFYVDPVTVLRTHTSPVQARTMEKSPNKPLKMICPGKTYRRDDDDMTHSHQFAQIEGLVIDENINLGNLKATLEMFLKRMFGEKRTIRFRSSYFTFTEPSVEVDVSCSECNGKGCSMCKGTGYIEILGAGMVHPNVLKMSGYDPEKYSGFAFGIGIERVAILRYEIDDIRKFYTNDLRFVSQFTKKNKKGEILC